MHQTTERPPIIVDLGKVRRKKIKALKRGRGPLASEVQGVLDEVRAGLGEQAKDKEFVPIVMVYRKKSRRRRRRRDDGFFFC
jgi:hypothetical protein